VGHDRHQAARGGRRATPPPQALLPDEPAILEPGGDQVVQEEGIALGDAGQLAQGGGGDRASQDPGHQLLQLRLRQRLQLQSRCQVVLRERDDRLRGGLTAAHGGQHEGAAAAHQLVDERGGARVQQVRVIDVEQQPATPGPGGEGRGEVAQHRQPAGFGGEVGRDQVGEGTERDVRCVGGADGR